MKKFLIVLSLAGFGGAMATPTVSMATGITVSVKGGDDKEKAKAKKSEKKSCCSHGAKHCGSAEKKAESPKAEKAI